MERDLSIWVSNDLKWETQCKKIVAHAMSIRKTLTFFDVNYGFKLLYNVYIRHRLEFCVQAWLPYFKKDIDCMGKVQYRATKMVYEFGNQTYEETFERLNQF